MKKILLVCITFLALLFLISCSAQKTAKEMNIDQPNLFMEMGTTRNLKVIMSPTDVAAPEIEWSSSNEKVATVDNTGLVKAISVGTAIITVKTKDGKLSVTSIVTVKPKSVQGIKFNKDILTLKVGSNDALKTTIEPVDAENQKVTWESSNTKIATVDEKGTVIAVAAGTADLIVRTQDGGFTAKCSVTIVAIPQPSTISKTPIPNNQSSPAKSTNPPFAVEITYPKNNSSVPWEDLNLTWTLQNDGGHPIMTSIIIFNVTQNKTIFSYPPLRNITSFTIPKMLPLTTGGYMFNRDNTDTYKVSIKTELVGTGGNGPNISATDAVTFSVTASPNK